MASESFNYHINNRKTDQILTAWQKKRDETVETLLSDPKKDIINLWNKSNDCMYNKYGEDDHGINEYFSKIFCCGECRLLKRILAREEQEDSDNLQKERIPTCICRGNIVGDAFPLQCGRQKGTYLTAIEQKNVSTVNSVRDMTIPQFSSNYKLCNGTPSKTIREAVGSDDFSNEVIQNLLLQHIWKDYELNHLCKLQNFFICSGEGFKIYNYPMLGHIYHLGENPDFIGNKTTIHSDVCRDIFFQLVVALHTLAEYDFIHGSPNVKSIAFSDKKTVYNYPEFQYKCRFTVELCNFHNSGITVNERRFYSASRLADRQLQSNVSPFVSYRDGRFNIGDNFGNCSFFLKYWRHSGLPIFTQNLDIIGFFLSLMSYAPFYRGFMDNAKLKAIWEGLWTPVDLSEIEGWLRKYHEAGDYLEDTKDVFLLLSNKWLKCDALKYCWDSILQTL